MNAETQPIPECNDNDSPWLICKPCAAEGKCKQAEPVTQNDWMWEDCGTALESMTCPWCDRQGTDTCQHADDAKNCEKTK